MTGMLGKGGLSIALWNNLKESWHCTTSSQRYLLLPLPLFSYFQAILKVNVGINVHFQVNAQPSLLPPLNNDMDRVKRALLQGCQCNNTLPGWWAKISTFWPIKACLRWSVIFVWHLDGLEIMGIEGDAYLSYTMESVLRPRQHCLLYGHWTQTGLKCNKCVWVHLVRGFHVHLLCNILRIPPSNNQVCCGAWSLLKYLVVSGAKRKVPISFSPLKTQTYFDGKQPPLESVGFPIWKHRVKSKFKSPFSLSRLDACW